MPPKLGLENVLWLRSRTDAFGSRARCFWMVKEPLQIDINP